MFLKVIFSNVESRLYDKSVSSLVRRDFRRLKVSRSMSSANTLPLQPRSTTADRYRIFG